MNIIRFLFVGWIGYVGLAVAEEPLLKEDFEAAPLANTRENGAGKMGSFYKGRHLWQTASNGKAGDNAASVEVVTDSKENHWLMVDATGSEGRGDAASFRTADWNPADKEVLRISMRFRLDPGDQKPRTWGALILVDRAGPYDMETSVPPGDEQQVHLRFHSSGKVTSKSGDDKWKDADFEVGKGKIHQLELLVNGSTQAVDGVPSGEVGITLNGTKVKGTLPMSLRRRQDLPVAMKYLEFRVFGDLHSDKGDPITFWVDDVEIR